jgi:hypothetical protein
MARTKPCSPRTPTPHALSPLPPNTFPILRTGPSAVAYHIPISPPTPNDPILKTTLSLPPSSTWSSGLHFHTTHTEYLHLLKGSIHVSLDGECKILSVAAGGEIDVRTGKLKREGLVVEVPKGARHEWMRAEAWYDGRRPRFGVRPTDARGEVVVEEWVEPGGLGKPLFFWNLNGIIMAPKDSELSGPQKVLRWLLGGWWIPFQLFVVFWELDNWPVFVSLRGSSWPEPRIRRYAEGRLECSMTFVVLFAAKVLGWLFSIRAVEQRRTPDKLWEAYKRHSV